MKLEIENLSCGYGGKVIIENISLSTQSGEILCLLGPNGSGKTTFFKTILGLLKVIDGKILINGKDIKNSSCAERAKIFGYIPQAHNPQFAFRVLDVILMGRTAYLNAFSSPEKEDVKIAQKAMDILNIAYLENKNYTEISGGERQLVLIARALTQNPKILIMDEPSSSLDFGNQFLVLNHMKDLAESGLTVIMSTHYPEHAFFYATKVMTFQKCKFLIGTPEEIVTEKNLEDMYGVNLKIVDVNEKNGIKVCIPNNLLIYA